MKRTIIAAALAASLALPLGGCAWLESLQSAQTTVTTPFAYQDQTVDAATLTYNALGSAALVYLTSPHADPVLKQKIKDADNAFFPDLQTAWAAQDRNDNAAVAVALNHLNTDNTALRAALQLAGVTVP